ncbi:MAG: DUF4258 domain-containing protein [Thermodesulfobacteriota bacterium]|nr:DUF4258 domain-containing protein [Thermodesulfobacteriota bacterium]
MTTLSEMLKQHFEDYQIEYRIHAVRRMFQRNINENNVERILKEGTVIEQYDDDLPLPSLLINGINADNSPLHVVAAINSDELKLIIITTYKPDPLKWNNQFSGRNK